VRLLMKVALVVCVVTPVFNVLTNEASFRSALQGAIDAVIVTALVGGYVQFVREGVLHAWFRRRGFWTDFLLNSAIFIALFLVGRATGQVIMTMKPARFVRSFSDEHLVYALPFFAIFAFAVQFVVQMNRM